MLFSTGKRTVVCDRLGQELQGNFCSHGQSLSIEPLSPRSDGDRRGSRHPLHPAAPLPTEGARQALRCVSGGAEPHPANQSVSGSQHHVLEILPRAPVDVKLSPGMPAAAPGTGSGSGLLQRSPGDGSSRSLRQPGGGWMSLSDGVLPRLLFIQKDVSPLQCFKLSMVVMGSRTGPAANR